MTMLISIEEIFSHIWIKNIIMKTVIVPTDFSKAADNAARYALKLCAQLNAQIILLNVYTIPVVPYEVPMNIIPEQDIKTLCTIQLRKFVTKLNHKNPGKVPIKIACVNGSADRAILEFAENKHADIIVLGTHGESASISRLFGNTTSYVFRNSKIPVLAVPAHARYTPLHNVLVACDKEDTFTDPIIHTLQELSKTFGAKLNMVKVSKLSEAMIYGVALDGEKALDEKLGDVPHKFTYEIMPEAVDGINKAAKKMHADVVVLIAHKHDLVTRIFKTSTTKKAIETTKKPMLILPEKISKKRSLHVFETAAAAK
jgi:nucleotide-binding universal stress UspA family protein